MSRDRIEQIYQLTPLQQGIIFHSLYSPESTVFNLQSDYTLEGELDHDALRRSFDYLLSRHAVLRTGFVWERVEKPYQVVNRVAAAEIRREDLSALAPEVRADALAALVKREKETRFELRKPPLLRLLLVVLGERRHHLVWTFHHVVLEGWSFDLLSGEFWKLYEDFSRGRTPDLPAAKPYASYIDWLERQDRSRAEDYWRARFADFSQPTQLPFDRSSAGEIAQAVAIGEQRLELPPSLTEALKQMTRRYRITQNTLFQGLWGLLLARYSGDDSVVFGTAVSGRPPELPGSETIVGLFVNTLPVRVTVEPGKAVAAWLQSLQLEFAGMREFEYSSLMQIRSLSGVPAGQPLFNTMLAFETLTARPPAAGAALSVTNYNTRRESDQALTLFASLGDCTLLTLMYDTERYRDDDVRRMLGHIRSLLEGMLAAPEQPLSRLSMLSGDEHRRLLVEWNRTRRDYDRGALLPARWRARVAAAPQAPALEYAGRVLGYAELDAAANRLARFLLQQGIGRDRPVAVLMRRCPELVIAQLAVLKAGGAYVPMDPDYPPQRLDFILDDTAAPVLLTQTALASRPSAYRGLALCLDSEADALAAYAGDDPALDPRPDDLAYVIYTSGSTGEPKGVEITHGGLLNLVCWHNRAYAVSPADRATHLAGLGFDASVWELWPYLCAGASVHLVPDELRLEPSQLWGWMAQHGITLSFLPTPLAEAALRAPLPPELALRVLLTGGDRLHGGLADTALPFRLVNHYGPSENSVVATCGDVDPLSAEEPPIGRPIDNVSVYILDAAMQPVPEGVAGELYIGGDGLARGYLNRPRLTAEKFVDNPFAGEAGARLYRSGDIARYRADGAIEFIGRSDHQVKLRGFRIELGEIEAALLREPGIDAAVVLLREDQPGERCLVAYLAPAAGDAPDPVELRAALGERLPEYMLPAAFVYLESFPLSANGKVDRDALPAPARDDESPASPYLPPRTELEAQLTQVWCEVLRRERVGIDDNFFELGGHSLLGTQVTSRVRERFQVELPLSALFANPTVAQLAPVVEALGRAERAEPDARIDTAARGGELPLSYPQQRLWFLDQLEPGSPAYNVPGAFRLAGPLDVAALRACLQGIVDRHEVLRTRFVSRDGRGLQVVLDAVELEVPLEDLSGLARPEAEALLERRLGEDALTPFDLATGPMLRCRLLRLADDEHILMFALHHIAADGWSLAVLFRELGALYAAYSRGRANPLPALKLQYADFALMQRDWLRGPVLNRQLEYWKAQLDGLAPQQLPTDRPRPALQSHRGAHRELVLEAALSAQLDKLSRQQDATPFMTLLAGFSILLQRYSGQDDIAVGTPIANRNRAETRDMIGFFVNTLVLRSDLSGDPAFTELLERVRQTALDAYEHQDLPFEMLVDELKLQRDRSRNPLFQVLFAVQNMPAGELSLEGVSLTRVPAVVKSTRFDLELHIWQRDGRLHLNCIYNTDLFDAPTIERMLRHYRLLLQQIADQPTRPVRQLELLDADERRRLVNECNGSRRDFPAVGALAELFAAQVAAAPHAVALEFDGERLDYRELNARANRLAHYLQRRGVGPDRVVGICLPRGPEAVIALLAVLKSGGGYTPLDPSYPPARLEHMLRESRCAAVVTQRALLSALPSGAAETILIDAADWSECPAADPDCAARPGNCAYVIFTSGSTGRPKGILMPQRALANLIQWQLERSGEAGRGRTLQYSAFGFDVSFQEIYSTLCAGGTLVLIDDARRRDPAQLLDFLEQARVNRIFMPFAGLNQLAEAALRLERVPESLREVVTAGEALQITPAIEYLFSRLPRCRLDNHYGPSETHAATAQRLEGDARGWPRLPPIGRPIANARVYLLDTERRPVPVGVPGELYIGGAGLASGYVGREDLTAEKFSADPFAEDADARIYRSGDLARYRADGAIEFLGRVDSQVKLRGYRIELAEIEAVLAEQAGVRACAATLREDRPGDRRLVAYYVGSGLAPAQLRDGLKRQLPDFMLPSTLVELQRLPLTPSGKVDRRALPAPDGGRQADEEYVAPATETERRLAAIWREVIGVDRVGIYDNFFDIGGHSLLATRMASRVQRQFGAELPLAEIFAHPTLAELAPVVEALASRVGAGAAGPVPRAPRDRRLPLSFAQERLWFLEQLDPGNASYNMPLALQLDGALDSAALEAAFAALLERHEALRSSIVSDGGEPCMLIAEDPGFELPVEDLEALAESDREAVIRARRQQEWRQGFDLGRGPLLRARLLKLGAERHILLFTLHHIVFDGRSMEIFLRELSLLYRQQTGRGEAGLAPLPLQYPDYACWLRDYLQGDNLARRLEYWKQALDGYEVLNLPTDHPRPPLPSYRGRVEACVIDGVLLEALRSFARKHGATLYMMTLSAFKILLHRYSGQDDITIGSPIAGRNRREFEDVVGLFMNTLVIRTRLGAELNFVDVLQRVKQASLDAHAHQDIPFEKLVEELHPQRDPSRNPLFQVMFNFVDVSEITLSLPGIAVSRLDNPVETTKFDLTFYVLESAERVELCVDYSLDLYTADSAREMLAHYRSLLHSIVERPQQEISALPLLPRERLEQLAGRRNAIHPDVIFEPVGEDRLEHGIPEVFAEIAARMPGRPAVVTPRHSWTYAELARITRALAASLLDGAGADAQQVAILFAQDAPMLAAIIGVLRAGKTYVPLDAGNPAARLALILEDCEAGILLADDAYLDLAAQLQQRLDPGRGLRLVPFSAHRDYLATADADLPAPPRGPDALTYLLYTSGSTGEPKAVMQCDRNVLHHARVYAHSLHLRARDRVSMFASYAFDAGVMDIFATLLCGATLYPCDIRASEVGAIDAWLERNEISILHLTPTLYRHLFTMDGVERVRGVRALVLGGEAVTIDDFRLFRERFDEHCLFVNGFGPTESTTALQYWMNHDSNPARQSIPVGYPVEDTQLLLLDPKGRETDVFGEIAIRSRYLARGYWRQPQLTAQSFDSDPERPEVRTYRSGDMGRRRLDGCIEFTGRRDQQVKIRGFRIELAEIEAALCRHPRVEKAAVICAEHRDEPQLVAYFVAPGEPPLPAEELRRFARERLPDYMLPAQLVPLDELPITITGKLARQRLPVPDFSYAPADEVVAPGTATERVLHAIWSSVLQLDDIGVNRGFFDLGGHSLKATQVVSRIRQELGVALPLRVVFSHPTIAEMASYIDDEARCGGAGDGDGEFERIRAVADDSDLDLDRLDDEQVERLLSEMGESEELGQ